jgi:hypothetical protein
MVSPVGFGAAAKLAVLEDLLRHPDRIRAAHAHHCQPAFTFRGGNGDNGF